MIAAETAGGSSFKGAALYYLHDKRQDGEAERLSADRVAWIHIRNLPTDDPDRAWRMMAHTAMAQAALKEAAGIRNTGCKLTKPVMAYSLAWHPEETPTEAEMLAAALDSLKALGLEDHQAMIVAHRDEPHPHVHVILNRVRPDTGVAATLSHSRRKLSAWALAYEQGRGRIYCPERVANDARRRGLRPGERVQRCRRLSRPEYEAAAGRQRSAAAAAIRADHAGRFGDLAAAERHQRRRRAGEADRFYRDRQEARQSIRERLAGIGAAGPPDHDHDRIALILAGAQPELALAELTRTQSTFTRADIARLVARHTDTVSQFQTVMARLEAAPGLIRVGRDGRGRDRYTTSAYQAIERDMERNARALHATRRNGDVTPRWNGRKLGADQDLALRHVLAAGQLAAVTGFAGSGKSTMLDAARQSWERAGLRVLGTALSGVAADGLKTGAGIDSRTIHSRLHAWERGETLLTARDVLVVDEAGMVGSRQMAQLLAHVAAAGAKIVLVGDAQQLQAIEAGGAFRAIVERCGAAALTTVRRQRNAWQQEATRALATGGATAALRRYEAAGMVHAHETQAAAVAALVDLWHRAGRDRPADSQIMLAYTKADVRSLNEQARARLRADGRLGPDHATRTAAGPRRFAIGDRLYFLKNDSKLGVRNGTLGTVERIDGTTFTVRLDGQPARTVTFSTDHYAEIDHGYAATIHKSQGVTVDRAHLLASRNLDRHSAYVALTRHRDRLDLHWSAEAIGTRARLDRLLSREALKDTSLDYGAGVADQAGLDAAEDLQRRLEARAALFQQRERSAAGRLANARSLAGATASPAAVARLALDRAGRARLFRQRQAVLQARAAQAQASAMHPPRRRQGTDEHRATLIAFDAETAVLARAMRERFSAERQHERQARRSLRTLAAQIWRKARLLAAFTRAAGNPLDVPAPERLPAATPRQAGFSPTLH